MSEAKAIKAAGQPITVADIVGDLSALGFGAGDVLILHASLKALGWVCGGPVAVLEAIEKLITERGTLVMPAFSSDYSEPSYWESPPVPESWWPTIRASMPAFDPALTPSRGLGSIAEIFRRQPGALRSLHPSCSFAARGTLARRIVGQHSLDFPLGEGSPLARLYEHDAWILLLGTGHDRNTSLHLAEHRAEWPGKRTIRQGGPIRGEHGRQWVEYDEFDTETEDFLGVGEAFSAAGLEQQGRVGQGLARLMRQRQLVDFATAWFSAHRGLGAPLDEPV